MAVTPLTFSQLKRKLESEGPSTPKASWLEKRCDGWINIPQPFRLVHMFPFQLASKKCLIINLIDKEEIEWRAQAWEEPAMKIFQPFKVGDIIEIKGYRKEPSKGDYTRIKNPKQLTFTKTSTLGKLPEDDDFPDLGFNYISNTDVASHSINDIIDIVSIYKKTEDRTVEIINEGTPSTMKTEVIVLTDEFCNEIIIQCSAIEIPLAKLDLQPGSSIVGFKGLRLLATEPIMCLAFNDTIIEIDPECKQTKHWKAWMQE